MKDVNGEVKNKGGSIGGERVNQIRYSRGILRLTRAAFTCL